MSNVANFSFTKQADVFSKDTILPGTAVHVQGGTRADNTFFEGNGIVTSVDPLSLVIELYELHRKEFQTVTVTIEDFLNGKTDLQVLTIEDGVGTEATGAVPSDLTPPGEVTNLAATFTDTTVTLTYEMPTDADFSHVQIFKDDVLVQDNVTATTYTITGLTPETEYEFVIKTVDTVGNISQGSSVVVTTNDVTPPGEVTNLQATNITSDGATLTYTLPTDTDFSHVQIFDGTTLLDDNITTNTYDLTGLTSATQYTITVKTVDNSGNVSNGTSVTFTTT
jgi:hypothetical protein